jgi:hypothetical protein
MGQLSFQSFAPDYTPRAPEHTVLYKTVAKHIESFYALAENGGRYLPKHVRQEFDAFLHCGILAYGFLRLQCQGCKSEKFVAFSCKKRGFCSSCGGRRMSESAAHLVDEVFPRVGVRQWVVSFPFPIRFLLARSPKLQSKVLAIALRAIHALIQKKVRRPGLKINTGAVTILQRFGGSLNLNLHLHINAVRLTASSRHHIPLLVFSASVLNNTSVAARIANADLIHSQHPILYYS